MSKHDAEARRLAAIMFTDIAGYTALMGRDEAHAIDIDRGSYGLHEPFGA